jgi:cation:H+ antiporter
MFQSVEIFSIPLLNLGLLFGAFALLLGGAEMFTNSVEWFGYYFGVSESATGSILAAVGTALPETMIPVIAIVSVLLGRGNQAAADAIGVGAILGAPFMLATIAMTLVGVSVLYFGSRRDAGRIFEADVTALRRDLSFFLVGYTFAVVAAFVPSGGLRIGIALGLVVLYAMYVKQTLAAGQLIIGDDLDRLHLKGLLTEDERPFPAFGSNIGRVGEPPLWMVVTQTVFALLVIIAGAHLFVTEVEFFSTEVLDVPAALIALLLAPLATELPEKFNSIIWISEGKDTLAIGNITGAMVFQGTLPATLGILFTSWDLGVSWGTIGFLNTLSAVLALIGGGAVLLRTQFMSTNRMRPAPFLVAGLLYVVFITVVIYHVVILGVAAGH